MPPANPSSGQIVRSQYLFGRGKPNRLFVDQQGHASPFAAGRVARAGRVDDETAGWVRTTFIELVALNHEYVLIADVLVKRHTAPGS